MNRIKKYLIKNNITLIFVLFLSLIFFYKIDRPFLAYHDWRQADVAQVARNFYETGHNIFHPEINWNGTKPGYVEMEFPLVPWIASIFYSFFGVQEYIARSVVVLFSFGTIFYTYHITKRLFNTLTAQVAIIMMVGSPLNILMSSLFMTDPAMIFFSVMSIYHFLLWTKEGKNHYNKNYFIALFAVSFTILTKAPGVFILLPLFFLALQKYKLNVFKMPQTYFFIITALILPLIWYMYAHFSIFQKYGNTFIFWTDKGVNDNFEINLLLSKSFYKTMIERGFGILLGPIIGTFTLTGLAIGSWNKKTWPVIVWILSWIFFILVAPGSHLMHNYYQLPLIAPSIILAAYTLVQITHFLEPLPRKISLSLLLFVIVAIGIVGVHDKYDTNMNVYYAGNYVEENTQKKTIVLAHNQLYNPSILYYTGRKGWLVMSNELQDTNVFKNWKDKGVEVFISSNPNDIPSNTYDYLISNYEHIIQENVYLFVDFTKPINNEIVLD